MLQKNFSRVLTLVLAVMFVLAIVLTGCGQKNDATVTTPTVASTGTTTMEKTSEITNENLPFVTLNYLLPYPNQDESNQASVEANFNKKVKEKINAELHFVFIDSSNYDNKMNLMAASGEAFDIRMATSALGNISQAVAKGNIIPIDDLLNKYGQTIMKRIETKYWPAVTYNGKKYAIPHPFVYAQPNSFVFRKDIVEKYNFDYKSVKTYKDLEPLLKTIKLNEKDMVPLYPQISLAVRGDDCDLLMVGLAYYPSVDKVQWVYDWPQNIEIFKVLNDYYTKGYISKDRITVTDEIAEMKSGKYAVFKDVGVYSEDGSKSSSLLGFPCVETKFSTRLVSTNSVQTCGTGISSTSKNPERAMMLVDLLYSDKKFLNEVCYGVEGQDYKVILDAGTDNPTVETNQSMKWAIWQCWIGPLWDQWPSNWNSAKALSDMQKFTDEAPVSQLLGFNFNVEPVKKEIAQIAALTGEADKILQAGSASDVDKYIADLKTKAQNAGLDKVINEANSQIAAWRASNGK